MRSSFLISQLDGVVEVRGPGDPDVTRVTCDSRAVRPGTLFVAMPGTKTDGREFIPDAVRAGAVIVIAEGRAETGDANVPLIQVKDASRALARVADVLHAKPSHTLKVVGVTGTNGKTTTTFLVHHLMTAAWHQAGLIGTVFLDDGVKRVPVERTTPQSHEIHAALAAMRDNGCKGVAMEVSSHGLAQGRVHHVRFDVGIFTNLSRDHLDYHGTMEAYYEAKQRLAMMIATQREQGGKDGLMGINTDDIHGQRMARDFAGRIRVCTYGFGARSDFRVLRMDAGLRGTQFTLSAKGREFLVRIPLIGRFNVYNAVAALVAADGLDLNFREAVQNLASAPQIPGRMESVAENRPYRIFVDYCHTPDALENALETLRAIRPARVITVVGCGGDRDREKRPMMARIASEMSNICILTSDNPRSEEPAAILRDMEAGITGRNYKVVPDRAEAIHLAVALAGENDIVLLAGKGHEAYQETNGVKAPFDDREVARFADRERKEKGGAR